MGHGVTADRRPVVVVTGAARGGGRGVALAFAAAAGTVILVGRSTREHPNRLLPGTLEQTREELAALGAEAVCFPADLARPAERAALCAFVADELGGCDVLVNNAAYNPVAPFAELSAGRWAAAVEVNLNAAVDLTRGLLPGMLARGAGRVVNVGSAAATTDFGMQLAYAVAKAGLERFTTGLATELAGTGVAVNCVRVDEALHSEALAAMIDELGVDLGAPTDPAAGATPEQFGAAVRWVAEQPTSFTGNVLTFRHLRDVGALVASGGVL